MPQIICAFCFDGQFVNRAAVAITSVCVHAESQCKIYCLVSDIADNDVETLRTIALRFHVEIVFIYVENQFIGWQTQPHISTVAYCRLLIPSYVPESRAIYLDCDLLVTCDLKDLFDSELGESWVAGCQDHRGKMFTKIKVSECDSYINSGVLVLDLDRLRAEKFDQQIRPTYEKYHSEFSSTDQCLFNKMTEGRKHILDRRWNVMAHDRPTFRIPLVEWCGPFDRQGILHFSGEVKPWHPWSGAWEARLWQGYARLAGVPNDAPRDPATVAEWTAVALKAEAEGDWRQAATARKILADYYRKKAIPETVPGAAA